jgi:hypothetical protein
MSRFVLKFGGDPRSCSGDFSVVAGCCRVDGSVDGGDEFGHLMAAADASERALGFDHAGRDPALFISLSRQCLTRPVTVRTVEIIDSMQFVFVRTFYTTSRAACGRRLRVHEEAPARV